MADNDERRNGATQEVNTEEIQADVAAGAAAAGYYPQQPAEGPPAAPGNGTFVAAPRGAGERHVGEGVEGEEQVWAARYSMKNFIGRFVLRIALTIAWGALAYYAWGVTHDYRALPALTVVAGVLLVFYWLYLLYQVLMARYGHYYRLTTRRLFVSTGVFHRRRDQVELLRINDVYTKQPGLLYRWLSVGTVVVESSEDRLPITYITGVDDPKGVMDLIWHHARVERDRGAVKVDRV